MTKAAIVLPAGAEGNWEAMAYIGELLARIAELESEVESYRVTMQNIEAADWNGLQAELARLREANEQLREMLASEDAELYRENARLRESNTKLIGDVNFLGGRLADVCDQRDTLLAALRELRDKAINRLTEDSPMLLIDVRDIDAILSEVEEEK